MIKINNLNKFFNKNKTNEIHVINNMTLELPSTGIVALFGKSGCGKTTLLNAIGGLDKVNSGSIAMFGHSVEKYSSSKWDNIRNKYIGYIFQNYNLVERMTVFENLEVALTLTGIIDKTIIKDRITSALESVGMVNYRNRLVTALSGGQQQRVAIARAIVKSPKIVIADEPTGNLDEKNTIQVMNILKEISKNYLVLLVTHEKRLVKHYADRVLEIVDGKISEDYENIVSDLDSRVDETIYLKELNLETNSLGDLAIKHYSDNMLADIALTIVEYDGKIHIKAESSKKIVYLDNKSDVELVDSYYTTKSQNDDKILNYKKLEPIEKYNKPVLITTKQAIKNGTSLVFSKKKKTEKLANIIFFCSAIVIVFMVAMISSGYFANEKYFVTTHKDQYVIAMNDENILDSSDMLELIAEAKLNGVNSIYPTILGTCRVDGDNSSYVIPTPIEYLKDTKIKYGRTAIAQNEAVISIETAESLINDPYSAVDLFADSPDDLLGKTLNNIYNIVGIADYDSPAVWLDVYYTILNMNSVILEDEAKELGIIDDSVDIQAHQILVPDEFDGPRSLELMYNSNRIKLKKINMTFDKALPTDCWGIVSEETVFEFLNDIAGNDSYYDNDYNISPDQYQNSKYIVYFDDIKQGTEFLESKGVLSKTFDIAEKDFLKNVKDINKILASMLGAVIIIIIMIIYFINRSHMIQRIKEIGVQRAIGARKRDIYKAFIWEIVAMTSFTSLLGFIISSIIASQLSTLAPLIFFNLPIAVLTLIGIYGINILFGLLPLFMLLRKTPAEILAKYDI